MAARAQQGRQRSGGRAARSRAAASPESPPGGVVTPLAVPWRSVLEGPDGDGEDVVDTADLLDADAADLPTPVARRSVDWHAEAALCGDSTSRRARVAREWVRRCFSSTVDSQLALLCRSPRSRGSVAAEEADADAAPDGSLNTSATPA